MASSSAIRLMSVVYRHPEWKHQALAAVTVLQAGEKTTAVVATQFRKGEMSTKELELKKNERGYRLVLPGRFGTYSWMKEAPTVPLVVEAIREHYFPFLIPCQINGSVVPKGLREVVNPFS